jgi:hypothetical protein
MLSARSSTAIARIARCRPAIAITSRQEVSVLQKGLRRATLTGLVSCALVGAVSLVGLAGYERPRSALSESLLGPAAGYAEAASGFPISGQDKFLGSVNSSPTRSSRSSSTR